MDVFLPQGFEAGRDRPRAHLPVRAQKLRVEAGGIHYPVLRRWHTGFAVSSADVPKLEGVVRLFNGTESLGECLIIRAEAADEEVLFTVKRATSFNYASVEEIEALSPAARSGS